MGTAIMIRPIAIGLPIILFIVAVLVRNSSISKKVILGRISIMIIGIGLVTIPWSIIVYELTGKMIFVTDGTLIINSLYNGMTFGITEIDQRMSIGLSSNVLAFMTAIKEVHESSQDLIKLRLHSLSRTYDINEASDVISLYVTMLWHSPITAAEMIYVKVTRAWYGTYSHRLETLVAILMAGYVGICIIGATTWRAAQVGLRERAYLVFPVVGYFWILTAAFEPLVRYMVPSLGLMFLFTLYNSANRQDGNLAYVKTEK